MDRLHCTGSAERKCVSRYSRTVPHRARVNSATYGIGREMGKRGYRAVSHRAWRRHDSPRQAGLDSTALGITLWCRGSHEHGAKATVQNKQGMAPLHVASRGRAIEAARFLPWCRRDCQDQGRFHTLAFRISRGP